MTNNSESGHGGNVANFEALITAAQAFGNIYNPAKESLKLTALQALLFGAKSAVNSVNVALSSYSNAVAARESAFEPLSKLTTRVNNALKATDTTTQVDDSAHTLVRKIQGIRASAKYTEEEKKALEAEGKSSTQISASQMGYIDRIDNVDKLITLLSSIPKYAPNEEDLKISSLSTYRDSLKAKNNDVLAAIVQLESARIARNEILYTPLTGIVDIAFDTKVYIKSVFGTSSPQYKRISKLTFVSRESK